MMHGHFWNYDDLRILPKCPPDHEQKRNARELLCLLPVHHYSLGLLECVQAHQCPKRLQIMQSNKGCLPHRCYFNEWCILLQQRKADTWFKSIRFQYFRASCQCGLKQRMTSPEFSNKQHDIVPAYYSCIDSHGDNWIGQYIYTLFCMPIYSQSRTRTITILSWHCSHTKWSWCCVLIVEFWNGTRVADYFWGPSLLQDTPSTQLAQRDGKTWKIVKPTH